MSNPSTFDLTRGLWQTFLPFEGEYMNLRSVEKKVFRSFPSAPENKPFPYQTKLSNLNDMNETIHRNGK